jgi:hypothetical protein
VEARWPYLERRKPLMNLGLAPQPDRLPQALTTSGGTILDPAIDMCDLCRPIRPIDGYHSMSVCRTSLRYCPQLHSTNPVRAVTLTVVAGDT